MNTTGIVICNYNKSEYVRKCVASLLAQTMTERDIFVVDNASTDDSVDVLRNQYGNRITILQNEENLGGAGGFDRGLEHCLSVGYEYILLVDNDTCFAPDALEIMHSFLETHEDVGMCGASILYMGNPDYIQEIGGMIDYRHHEVRPNYRNQKISDELPGEVECDFLAACALLVKREVVEKIGIMRRDYFVYWDDIEWARRCLDAGYRLVALRDAHVWHNWSANAVTKFNAFSEYYGRRNKLRFFATYIEDKDIDLFIDHTLRNMFNIIYGHYRKGAFDEMKMTLYALDDVMHSVWGKAPAYKTSVKNAALLPIEKLLQKEQKVVVVPNDMMAGGGVADIERVLRFCNPNLEIISCHDTMADDKAVLHIKPCPHVIKVKEDILPIVYVDRFLNCIVTRDDYLYFQNYENAYQLFYRIFEPMFKEGVLKIREENQ